MAAVTFEWRPIAPADESFCVEVHHLAMHPYVEPIWGWDESSQDAMARQSIRRTGSVVLLLLRDEEAVGYLSYRAEEDHLFLEMLCLHPRRHGHGYGSAILRRLQSIAAEAGLSIELSVLDTNPRARVLYVRHGFVVVGIEPPRTHMRWAAD